MYKSAFGKTGQISFRSIQEYYELLGFLAKSDGSTSIVWEHNENQGAWGSEGRIQFYVDKPSLLANLGYTAGVGKITYRVNCNEFIQNIVNNHNFTMGSAQNYNGILSTIPNVNHVDFIRGFNL